MVQKPSAYSFKIKTYITLKYTFKLFTRSPTNMLSSLHIFVLGLLCIKLFVTYVI